MKRFLVAFAIALSSLLVLAPIQVKANCDIFATEGSEHRNAGNGCFYVCRNGSWSGPTKCDGNGNGVCQGCSGVSAQKQAELVTERQREAATKISEQGTAATAQIAQQTAQQRAAEAKIGRAHV